ncbi:MAG: hypothetical protein WCK13_08040 [Ignavibacteriota bacterium]|nr:hypothetical protein [Ignavibacteriota bacterium]
MRHLFTKSLLAFLLFAAIPLSGICQNTKTTAFIKKEAEYSDYVHFTLKVFPARQDKRYNIEITQIDKSEKEGTLSASVINIETVQYKKGYETESGKVYESNYTAIKQNDTWSDDYMIIRDCSESTFLEGFVKLRKSGNYIIRIYNQDDNFFEEKVSL